MRPLRLCFLWHQHQPDYRDGSDIALPWVRLHGVKDYADLPLLLAQTPSIPHTINVAPSLLMQLDAYADGASDNILRLTRRPAADLTNLERAEIAAEFLVLERNTMTTDLPRFGAIADNISHAGWAALTTQDWLDLQVLYNLAWTGPVHRRLDPFGSLIEKGAGFNEDDKRVLLEAQHDLLGRIVPIMRTYQDEATIEITVTPLHHPILPLLCDSECARESMPNVSLPDPPMSAPTDAEIHVGRALDDAEKRFGKRPTGMWPAEGAISMKSLDILACAGIQWTASDESVLRNTLGAAWTRSSAYFPRRVLTESGAIAVLFRDHDLSDAIGFTYASWDPAKAAVDFVQRLLHRRDVILAEHDEEALSHAVVPIILDGENCWEFYQHNGRDFVLTLMKLLRDDHRFFVTTCSEATSEPHVSVMPHLDNIVAGSWIDGTFDVWIGTPLKNLAWSLVRDARNHYQRTFTSLSQENASQAYEHLLVAEASDWFWWYDDGHRAPHKTTFDVLFRKRLRAAWTSMLEVPPTLLDTPLYQTIAMQHADKPMRVAVNYGGSAMHESDLVAKDVRLEHSGHWQRVVLTMRRKPTNEESLTITIRSRDGQERACRVNSDGLLWTSSLHDESADYMSETEVAMYLHAASTWHVRIDEERGAVRTFTTDLS